MTISGGIILFSCIWFMALLISLQVGHHTQQDDGNVVPGTPASAPANASFKRRLWIVTFVSILLWLGIAAVILWGGITIRDLDFFNRLGPAGG